MQMGIVIALQILGKMMLTKIKIHSLNVWIHFGFTRHCWPLLAIVTKILL